VLVDYVLAPGAFDAAFASLLGIPIHTGGSELASSSMRLLAGDHSAPELEADDGGTSIIVAPAAVPEPALNVLFGLGLAAAAVRARRKT
jgi:PEP-CTERM motif-containing protein